ncbi:MAG: TIGR03960 family B12-binding radical SAM protein [Candidatus Omnitrophica bacterium]|nr:TIGR03960 family B12-binding radical SAM protein [Candidatus Omnitrophota bacterium]
MIPESIFIKLNRPAQYLGEELNAVKKDFEKAYIRFALCFPDTYAVAMSNLGLRIIYGILNSIEDVVCERVFLPEPDLENILRQRITGIFSWESKRDLDEFDIVGFSLSFELNYTGVLKIMELGGIPLFSKDRDEDYPLILGGGFCTLNPEPIADFFDLFIIGEAEEVILKLIEVYRTLKRKNHHRRPSKREYLHHLKYIDGIYIPSFYDVVYRKDGTIKGFSPNTQDVPVSVKKRSLKKIEDSFYPCSWIVPFTEIVHDRMVLEIMRGCPHACRFCQARVFYYPLRFRSTEKILMLSREIFRKTGYEELSLGGLSVSDYPQLTGLLQRLNDEFKDKKLLISFSSLREKKLIGELIFLFDIIKKSGLTFAPETGSQRLRRIINKEFSTEELFYTVEKAYEKGFRHLKLYFMIGLPSEEKEDLDGILDLTDAVYGLIKRSYKRGMRINLSINTFIPKPHTSFQWLALSRLEEIKKKKEYLFTKAESRRWLKVSFHNVYMSFLECLLSRADRRFSGVIYMAYKKGACFEAEGNFFSFDIWQEALKESGINPEFYIYRVLDKNEILPWDFIDTGLSKDSLWQDFKKIDLDL